MKRTKSAYENARGDRAIGYAILPVDTTETTYFWCFNSEDADDGFTVCTSEIIKVF